MVRNHNWSHYHCVVTITHVIMHVYFLQLPEHECNVLKISEWCIRFKLSEQIISEYGFESLHHPLGVVV
jgi:hypothetical protein